MTDLALHDETEEAEVEEAEVRLTPTLDLSTVDESDKEIFVSRNGCKTARGQAGTRWS
jgi:hypothetical protein